MATGIMWRDTARPIRFFIFDGRVLTGLAIWAVHMSMWTFYLAIAVMVLFSILEFFGMSPMAALRSARHFWTGEYRLAHNNYDIRRRARW